METRRGMRVRADKAERIRVLFPISLSSPLYPRGRGVRSVAY